MSCKANASECGMMTAFALSTGLRFSGFINAKCRFNYAALRITQDFYYTNRQNPHCHRKQQQSHQSLMTSTSVSTSPSISTSTSNIKDPILLRCARGEQVERPPVWLMRQAGRYMRSFRKYSDKYTFRERSETPEIAFKLSLQPYHEFHTDGVIMFSDILTPLPGLGIEFDVIKNVGPKIIKPIRTLKQINEIEKIEFIPHECLGFVGEVLQKLKEEVGNKSTLLGFVGAPFTLVAYVIEGGGMKYLVETKRMMIDEFGSGKLILNSLLRKLSKCIAVYAKYQIENGAQIIQLFDSWAYHLTPEQYEIYALPYVYETAMMIKTDYPNVPLIFFANGSGGKLENIRNVLKSVVDVVSLDWSVSMKDARRRLGADFAVQGNIDPVELLVGDPKTVRNTVFDCVEQAGPCGHILNLGHGVLQGTPEANVAAFCDAARECVYQTAPACK